MNRIAGKVWNSYKNNLLVQDIVETAVMSLGVAGAQALFSEMSPEEIAISGVLGIGAGMAGRPIGDRLGRSVGRWADKAAPVQSKQLRMAMDKTMADLGNAGEKNAAVKGLAEFAQAKMQHHLTEDAGAFEAALGYLGRQRGDNIAQGAVGALAPLVINQVSGSDSSEAEA